ncbi:MAG: hypothetical protein AAB797_03070 [Patescibacteria group bacterium]
MLFRRAKKIIIIISSVFLFIPVFWNSNALAGWWDTLTDVACIGVGCGALKTTADEVVKNAVEEECKKCEQQNQQCAVEVKLSDTGLGFGLPNLDIKCTPSTPTALENLQADLSARKPVLEINIPGLNFSDVMSSTDDTGTYFYIAWIPELISALYKFGIAIMSIVAVVMIIIQGLRIVTSGGGEAKTAAYKKIWQAVVGLFIAWGSFAILYNINPALVQFNALKVRVAAEEESSNPIIEEEASSATEPSTLPPGSYDSLFQKYANCVGINWRVLKMIALGENSKLNPAKVNDAGFIGFFQVRPDFCPGKFKGKYKKYADLCTVKNLKTPAFNTAVGALYQKETINLVNTYCKNGDVALQLQIFYSVLNTGAGGTKKILQYAKNHGGCTENNLREGSRIFWHDAKGGASAKWFVNYYPPAYCQEFTDKLDCMGIRKFNHTFASAKRGVARQGITSFLSQSSGICPLDTDTPFPPS